MSNYIGVKCPVCNNKFTQADDIVVCPVCGAPHHRGCYFEKGECVFAADHINGHEWRAPAPEPVRESVTDEPDRNAAGLGTHACPSCKAPNPKGAFFCQICGRPLQYGAAAQNPVQNPGQNAGQGGFQGFGGFAGGIDNSAFIYGGLSPDETVDDIPVRDLALYIGENSGYYLAQFKRMDETSRTLSFNLSSLIFGFFYFFYRKMHLMGSILLALFIISVIPGVLQMREYMPHILYLYSLGPKVPVNNALIEHYQWLVNVTGTINLFIGIVVSFCANWFYYIKTIRDVKKIRAGQTEPPDERAYAESLVRKGGVGKTAVIVLVCAFFAAYLIFSAVLFNQYMGGLA